MIQAIANALRTDPVTCAILVLYTGNVIWYGTHKQWGPALYWCAAATITVSATWLMGWRS